MAAMDEQLLYEDRLALQLNMGEEVALSPWDDEPFVVTHVFLVDPESVAGQGIVVTAGVKMGTRNIILAQLSSEVTKVELETPVVLDEEPCFYVMRPGGGTDADTDTDKDAIVVQFEGFVFYPDTDDESEEEEDEEAASLEHDDDEVDGDDGDDKEVDEEDEEDRLALQLQIGEEVSLSPWDDEPFVVTHVFLVDPESAAGKGVGASAGVRMGTRNIMLAQLSSEVTEVELETPVVLDEESCFYVMRPGGDADADTDKDKDAIVVQFEGYVLYPDTDEESEVEEEGDKESTSSEDYDDGIDKEEEEEEGDKESASSEDYDDGIDKEDEESESDGWVKVDVAGDVDGLQLEHA